MAGLNNSSLPLRSRYTRLRPPNSTFIDHLYEMAATDQIPWPWPVVSETPTSFRESLWSDVLTQFAIEDARNGRGVGLISAYKANPIHRYAYVSLILHPAYHLRVWPLEAVLLFANYLFVKFNMRKLYAESAEPYFAQFRSGAGSMFEVEGHFRDRVIVNGAPQDLYVLTFSRERWFEHGLPLLERCMPSPPRVRADAAASVL